MSKKNKIRNYVLTLPRWDWEKNQYVPYCVKYSWSGLINVLARKEIYGTSIIGKISENLNTTSYLYNVGKLIDNKIYNIDYDKLMKDFTVEVERLQNKRDKDRKAREAEVRALSFKFRYGNVPGIHKYKGHRGAYYRRPKLGRLRRDSYDIEALEFLKPKHRNVNLPLWDDRPRHNDKSWKTSYKCKKQWQKHNS